MSLLSKIKNIVGGTQEKQRKEKLLLLDKTLSSIRSGNKAEKVDALIKLSKFLNTGEYQDIFSGDPWSEVDSSTCNLDLEGVDFSNSRLENIDLSDSNLRNANLEKSHFLKTRMDRVDLENANLKNSALTFSSVIGANLKNVNLEGAVLQCVKFRNTNLLGANLQGAKLERADISDSFIKLSGLDLEIKLTHPNFNNATYDCNTKFPEDFDPKKEGMIEVDPSSFIPILKTTNEKA